jgi:hypothetical protein
MNAEIANYASGLLSLSGIAKVLSIDDAYAPSHSVEEFSASIMTAEEDVLNKLAPLLSASTSDPEILRRMLRESWDGMAGDVRDEIAGHLTPPEVDTTEGTSLENDLSIGTNLPEIFGNALSMLSLDEWNRRKAEFILADMPPTLFLVDLSFADEGHGVDEGLEIIKQLFANHPGAPIYCGLLTNRFSMTSIHSNWKALAHDNGLSQDRFVLIPKDTLRSDRKKFLALIKLALINPHARFLRETVSNAYASCLEEARNSLEGLDVYEFERIVCLSSSYEGVWELDTLSRIFSLFHKKLVRSSLHKDPDVHETADSLRALSKIPVGEWGDPTEMEIGLRRLEWFEDESDVNGQLLPVEVGDLFKIGDNSQKLYVLVAQPCDLMIREDGKRHHTVKHAILLEAAPIAKPSSGVRVDPKKKKKDDSEFSFNLEFFEPHADWRVNLREVHYVNLDALDLCAFRSDGKSMMLLSDDPPDLLSQAWKTRFAVLKKDLTKMVLRYQELKAIKGLADGYILKMIADCSFGNLIKPKIDLKAGTVSFNVCRTGRLMQPRSGALLARYANSLAREAFEHDLTRRPAKTYAEQSPTDVRATPVDVPNAPGAMEATPVLATQTHLPAVPRETNISDSGENPSN